LPATCLDLKINLGGVIRTYAAEQADAVEICTESWSVGLWNTCHVVEWPDDPEFYGVFFKVGGAYPFLHLPTAELHNRVISLDALWATFADQLREQLYNVPTPEAGLALLEHALLARLREEPPQMRIVQYALKEMAEKHGTVSIQALSDDIGISQNYLSQLFKVLVGGTPKEIARLYRFHHVLSCVDLTHPIDWTQVAHQSLYYDQSHFNKDFAIFTGHSPTDYLRLRRRVYAEHPEHAAYLRQLPLD
jgi:AraC-like DNA-binding protein